MRACREEDTVWTISSISRFLRRAGIANNIIKLDTGQMAVDFLFKEHLCTLGASIGISIYPQDGDDAETLVNKADAAMYCVKNSGKGGYAFSSPL